ncbi:hypothetical protein F5887DRAFT_1076818 [Amanita rubescens]|nr:hypothetical protein F5887DRAFT_1076818 [Amanita rubescens]
MSTRTSLRETWIHPGDLLPVLTLIGPDIIQRALAQLSGHVFTPITFSFGWVAYAFGSLALALGGGRLMPQPSSSIVINGKTGYVRNNNSWILGCILSNFAHWKPKPVEDALRKVLEEATSNDIMKASKAGGEPPLPRTQAGLIISVFSPSSKWKAGVPVADWVYYSGIPGILLQLGISVIPGVIRREWNLLLITGAGILLALATAALPQWRIEKWGCRRAEKTVILTSGNGAQHALVIIGDQDFLDLEALAAARPTWSRFNLFCTIMLALLWIVHLIIVLGAKANPWFLVAVGGIGMLHNIMVAVLPRRPEALGLPLEFGGCIANRKTMGALQEVEIQYPGVGLAMKSTFFPGGLREDEEEWWDGKAAEFKARTALLE